MPASLAPITPELFADFKGGKETALEQVFRANFEAFTQEANDKLQDIAAAQKVAASAFLDVWDRRGKLESSAQLEAMLHQAVNGEATHELRRRAAAHHMAGDHAKAAAAAAPETVDQWWIKVQGAMQQPQPAATDAAKRAEHMRHEAAAHMKAVAQPKRTGMFMAIGAVVFIGAAVPLYYMNQGAETTKAGQLLGREDAKVMVTKPGQRGTVTLEDSTVIRLGSATTVKYPKSYPLDAHALQIIGTAAIKAPKTDSPLLVKVGNAWLYVSEAEFVARSFPEDSGAMMLKATAGTLTVKFGKTEKSLAAGSTLLMLNNGTFMDLDKDRGEFIFAWADGNFAATHQPLRKVLAEIKKFYGIEILPKDSSFLDRPVSMTASLDSAKTAITALEEGGAVKVKLITETKAEMVDNAANVKPKN